MKKAMIIIVIVLVAVSGFIYFVSGITSGNSVIKKYSCSGNVKEFISHVEKWSSENSATVFKITGTTGTLKTG